MLNLLRCQSSLTWDVVKQKDRHGQYHDQAEDQVDVFPGAHFAKWIRQRRRIGLLGVDQSA